MKRRAMRGRKGEPKYQEMMDSKAPERIVEVKREVFLVLDSSIEHLKAGGQLMLTMQAGPDHEVAIALRPENYEEGSKINFIYPARKWSGTPARTMKLDF